SGVEFRGTLAGKAQDEDGIPITYFRDTTVGPAWLVVDADGTMHGKPTDGDVDDNNFVVGAKNDVESGTTALVITVKSDNSRPRWNKPVVLQKKARAGKMYMESVRDFASDPDPGDRLSFRGVNLPTWKDVYVTNTGVVMGIPAESHEGPNVFTIEVRDPQGATDTAPVTVLVDSSNTPPRWKQAAIDLGKNIVAGQEFSFELAPLAEDDDKDVLTFELGSGSPTWIQVNPLTGHVGGKPPLQNAGPFVASFVVKDGKVSTSIDAGGEVTGGNRAPIVNADGLKFSLVPGNKYEFELAQPGRVTDPEGQALTFLLQTPAPGISLSASGKLKIDLPASAKQGFTLAFQVSDAGGSSSPGLIVVQVGNEVFEPDWLDDLIELTGTVGQDVSLDLKNFAQDRSGLGLTFKKLSGDEWLDVKANGLVGGKPTPGPAIRSFRIEASNGVKQSSVEMRVTVQGGTVTSKPDVYPFTSVLPGPRAEILFVLDNPSSSDAYYSQMKQNTSYFIDQLKKADIHYSLAVLNAREFRGRVQANSQGTGIVSYQDNNPVYELNRMIDGTRSAEYFNSPIWALEKFFVAVKSYTGFYQAGFYEPNVPLLVYVHTANADRHQTVSQGSSVAGRSFRQAGLDFASFNANLKKTLRVYVRDTSGQAQNYADYQAFASPESVGYGSLVVSSSSADDGLAWFTATAITQARRFSKNKLGLSRKPIAARDMKVFIRYNDQNYPLRGNTGAADDQWSYEPTENVVRMHWWNIRMGYSELHDSIIVDYP
ncbi:hypothetical protein K2X33_08075, partial [bacterium]|nr:hypothetical protein [bacterium]